MTTMASQITSLTVVYSTVYSDADQRKHQSSASLAFVWGLHRDRWIPRTKGQLRGKWFHLMTSLWTDVESDATYIKLALCSHWLSSQWKCKMSSPNFIKSCNWKGIFQRSFFVIKLIKRMFLKTNIYHSSAHKYSFCRQFLHIVFTYILQRSQMSIMASHITNNLIVYSTAC